MVLLLCIIQRDVSLIQPTHTDTDRSVIGQYQPIISAIRYVSRTLLVLTASVAWLQ